MAKQFDLTSKICQYLDRHLTFPLLEFLCVKEVRICWLNDVNGQYCELIESLYF